MEGSVGGLPVGPLNFVISILLKLALTVVKDVFCDVKCVKCKKCMVLCFISVK